VLTRLSSAAAPSPVGQEHRPLSGAAVHTVRDLEPNASVSG
jgi:hypothetical protein